MLVMTNNVKLQMVHDIAAGRPKFKKHRGRLDQTQLPNKTRHYMLPLWLQPANYFHGHGDMGMTRWLRQNKRAHWLGWSTSRRVWLDRGKASNRLMIQQQWTGKFVVGSGRQVVLITVQSGSGVNSIHPLLEKIILITPPLHPTPRNITWNNQMVW